jgi:hypothetical protein
VTDLEESGCPVFSSNRLAASDCTGNEMSLAANTTCHYKSLTSRVFHNREQMRIFGPVSQMK